MNISADITGIEYSAQLCKNLNSYDLNELQLALSKDTTFLLKLDDTNKIVVSWWVSAKRTRSYPYARVYDSLNFLGKKVTIIPIIKDEGKDGDRDFLQWDTVSMMSLLGVYVIISYYITASQNPRYTNKITSQRYDVKQIMDNLKKLKSYQSDALHWNLSQLEKTTNIMQKSLNAYSNISKELGVEMHSHNSARKRVEKLTHGKNAFLNLSRNLAKKAQERERVTVQPKENIEGIKGSITISNYLGGKYYFTSDEVEIIKENIFLIEGKHSKESNLPSVGDIKDALLKMILFTNLTNVSIGNKKYLPKPIMKLTSKKPLINITKNNKQVKFLEKLKKESEINNFQVIINGEYL